MTFKPTLREKVVVIDDVATTQTWAKFALESAGYDVFASSNHPSAFLLLEREQPRLVLLDASDLATTGARLVRDIKDSAPRAVVVLHSARSAYDLSEMARDMRADGFIRKGWDQETMLGLARAYLDGDRPGLSSDTRRPPARSDRPSGKVYCPPPVGLGGPHRRSA